jgi:crotonobetainyl-CoA:carnitine CoA-transferase CaiB-like acyl-CoA transferase
VIPLQGIRVLELTLNISGALTGQILAGLGAQVVKIERPGSGDDCRAFGPPFVHGASVMYNTMNRGKSSVTLDLKTPQAIEWMHAQLADCDVLIENMRPGTLDAIGLGLGSLRARYPRLVCVSLSAFGAQGPLALKPGYEEVVQAFSGLFSVNGAEGSPPARVGTQILDMGTGVWGAVGCLAGLMQRQQTGEGCTVEGSLLETALAWLTLPLGNFSLTGRQPARSRSGGPSVAPYRCFQATDGEIVVAAINDRLFAQLSQALGHPEWSDDSRFKTATVRASNREAIHGLIEPIIATRPRAHWRALLEAAGVPCSPVNSFADVLAEPHVRQLDLFDPVPDTDGLFVRMPIRIDGSRGVPLAAAPVLGNANDTLLGATSSWPGSLPASGDAR